VVSAVLQYGHSVLTGADKLTDDGDRGGAVTAADHERPNDGAAGGQYRTLFNRTQDKDEQSVLVVEQVVRHLEKAGLTVSVHHSLPCS
jgi:hypothetical protein